MSTGNYIIISNVGEFRVGGNYLKDGEKWVRGTYYTDGKEKKYGF